MEQKASKPLLVREDANETNPVLQNSNCDFDLSRIEAFENAYKIPREEKRWLDLVRERLVKRCSRLSVRSVISQNLPFLLMLKNYRPKRDLFNDLIAGVTSGIMMIPQGMAFALLASLPPITGLYVCLFASLTYFLLGTSHHVSWGPVAVLSIMIGSVLDTYESRTFLQSETTSSTLPLSVAQNTTVSSSSATVFASSTDVLLTYIDSVSSTVTTASDSSSLLENGSLLMNAIEPDRPAQLGPSVEEKLGVACSVTLVGGLALAVLAKLGLGKVATFFSNSLITGFTVGASIHVCTSQVRTLLGLRVPRYNGSFKVIRTWVAVLSNIHHTNPATLIVSLISILAVYLVKKFVNERYKARLKVPIPIDLLLVVGVTVISYFASLHVKYGVSVVKDVPTGVPIPRVPEVMRGLEFVTDAVAIMVVSYAQSVAMAKIMGLKHNYKVDADQEMFACGVVNVVSSVFSGFVAGASMSRSLVQEGAGGRTQVASLVAAALVFVVIMVLGPYLYHLPACVLSAIIVVSLRAMILKILTIRSLWRKSPVDAVVWCVTCVAVVILDVDIGLLVGVVVSVVLVLVRSQVHTVDVVEEIRVGVSKVWRPKGQYRTQQDMAGTRVAKINGPLFFANAEMVINSIFEKAGVNPIKMKQEGGPVVLEKIVGQNGPTELSVVVSSRSRDNDVGSRSEDTPIDVDKVQGGHGGRPTPDELSLQKSSTSVSKLILDMSGVTFVDLMGVEALNLLIAEYDSVGISVYIAAVPTRCLGQLKSAGFVSKHQDIIFVTIEAVFEHLS